MKKLLLIFLTTVCFAQPGTVVKQWSMNKFLPGRVISSGSLWYFSSNNDSSSYLKDISGNNHNWEKKAAFLPTFPVISPVVESDSVIYFPAVATHNFLKTANHADFGITNSFSITLFVKPFNLSQSQNYYLEKDNNRWGLIWEFVNNQIEFLATTFTGANPRTGSGITLLDDWNSVVYTYNGTNFKGYLNGAEQFDSTKTFTLGTSTDSLWIGGSAASSNFGKMYVAYLAIEKGVAYTAKQVKEDYAIATGWNSYSGNVSRDSLTAWYQTFDTDTLTAAIGVAGTLGNNQEWYVTVTAKAKTAADTLDIYFVNKSSTQRKRVGTSWMTFTVPMGNGYNLAATDSIAIGGGSDFDFDNVVISRSTHHLKSPANRGWLGW